MKANEKAKYQEYIKLMGEHRMPTRDQEEWLRTYRSQQKSLKGRKPEKRPVEPEIPNEGTDDAKADQA